MISEDKLTSMIAWFEADGPKPNGVRVTRGDMAQALRELQSMRDAAQQRVDRESDAIYHNPRRHSQSRESPPGLFEEARDACSHAITGTKP